jgi:hypothetical protein
LEDLCVGLKDLLVKLLRICLSLLRICLYFLLKLVRICLSLLCICLYFLFELVHLCHQLVYSGVGVIRYCLKVCAYTAVNINVTRVTEGVTNEQMRKRRETDQLVKRRGCAEEHGGCEVTIIMFIEYKDMW